MGPAHHEVLLEEEEEEEAAALLGVAAVTGRVLPASGA